MGTVNCGFIKQRLAVMQFLQFFVWGAWLVSFGGYMFSKGMGDRTGTMFATMGMASLIMPALAGIVADRWISAERLLGLLHLAGACCTFAAARAEDFGSLYAAMLLNAMFFMPTVGLSYSVCYSVMQSGRLDMERDFPPVRAWGTVGFIAAMWIVNRAGWMVSPGQLLLSSSASLALGIYSLTALPKTPPVRSRGGSFISGLGLDALVMLKERRMAVFFLFSVLLGVCLQITNSYGSTFLHSFDADYPSSFAVKYNNIFLSVSQISEALFILAIPFFLSRFGIKTVILISLAAWVLRFALFGVGSPSGTGMIWLTISMIIYGMAFDFFNISASMFIDRETPVKFRASAQGLLMMATNGLGAVAGNFGAQKVINSHTSAGVTDWQTCWFIFAGYAFAIGILFAVFFKYKHVNK
ncbi:MAG: nucleoside permease [Dysgonamonadaceae bacterium]|jgi:NHS family xanthosine MFS transporter|nr:nucleoside permease [Dysgonamonadaceae bacterium]